MTGVVVSVIGGLILGSTLALIALGLVLVYRATDTFNFAHGQFMVFTPFIVAVWQVRSAESFLVPLVLGLVVPALIAVVFYATIAQRLVGLPVFISVIATLGLAAFLDGVIGIAFGTSQYVLQVPGLPTGSVSFLGAQFSSAGLLLMTVSLAVAALTAGVLRFSPLGLKVHAAGQNALLASQSGIRVHRIYVGSWAAAGVLAGIAGVTYASANVVSANIATVALFAFPAMLLGGLDSIGGALIGGLTVGLIQGFAATYFGGGTVDVVTYSVLLVVLLFLPQGLFGTRRVDRL